MRCRSSLIVDVPPELDSVLDSSRGGGHVSDHLDALAYLSPESEGRGLPPGMRRVFNRSTIGKTWADFTSPSYGPDFNGD